MRAYRQYQVQVVLLIALGVLPLMPKTSSYLASAGQAAIYAIVAASLVMLIGWVGQISLAHAAFVGIGAFATGWVSTSLGLVFPLSLPVAALVAGAVAALLGVVALRVRGLYLAVATLIFSWAASEYLFRQPWLVDSSTALNQAIGTPGALLYLDFSSRFVNYYIAWAVAVGILWGLVNLRDSKTGRAFYAVRGSEMAAASLGMDVLRYKTLAFGLSGAIAGIAGNLTITHAGAVSPDAYDFVDSLFYLSIAVVGGLTSLAGAVAAGVLFAVVDELFFRVTFLNDAIELFSALILAVVFRAYPGGLAAMGRSLVTRGAAIAASLRSLPARVERLATTAVAPPPAPDGTTEIGERERSPRFAGLRDAARGRSRTAAQRLARRLLRRRLEAEPLLDLDPLLALDATDTDRGADGTGAAAGTADDAVGGQDQPAATVRIPTLLAPVELPPREQRRPLVEAEHITVRFGGLTAVNDASLSVREGEITALIGPNGAGKTTLFNAIAGFNTPTEGTVRIYGRDVTGLPVFQRARLGVARTFQLIQLFPELTVFDNLLAATHLQNPTGFFQHMGVTPAAIHAEANARQRVRKVVELLGLEEASDRQVAGLPFGVLRMVEVARALVTGARVVMLDEPASGLDERETDELMDVLRFVRSLGASLLLIEHDVRMVTAVSDYVYVLDQGCMIAEGTPAEIQRDPAVVAAYLGASAEPVEVA